MSITTIVYANCFAYAKANGLDVTRILELPDIISWNDEITKDCPEDQDSNKICDGHIDYIDLCCKNAKLV